MAFRTLKLTCAMTLLFTVGVYLHARDITTLNGVTYKNVTVTNVTSEGIDISYSKGVKFIKFSNLPESIKEEFVRTKKKDKQDEEAPPPQKKAPTKKDSSKKSNEDTVDKVLKSL